MLPSLSAILAALAERLVDLERALVVRERFFVLAERRRTRCPHVVERARFVTRHADRAIDHQRLGIALDRGLELADGPQPCCRAGSRSSRARRAPASRGEPRTGQFSALPALGRRRARALARRAAATRRRCRPSCAIAARNRRKRLRFAEHVAGIARVLQRRAGRRAARPQRLYRRRGRIRASARGCAMASLSGSRVASAALRSAWSSRSCCGRFASRAAGSLRAGDARVNRRS